MYFHALWILRSEVSALRPCARIKPLRLPLPYSSQLDIIKFISSLFGSRASSVGIATGYGLDGQGVGVRVPPHNILTGSGAHPAPIRRMPGIKRPGREADNLPPASAEVKNMWIYTPTPPHVFML
jgi:hypothetical protein